MAFSALVFTGASQFAAATVIISGGTALAAVTSGLVLAARNAFYGPSVAGRLDLRGWRRPVAAHFVIDETTAMAVTQADPEAASDAFWFTGIWLFTLWNLGTVLGVLGGGLIADSGAWGLDAAFPAAFVALVRPLLGTPTARRVAIGAAVIAATLIPVAPAGVPIVASAGALVLARRRRP